jgi:hypothetical protein
MAGWIGNGGTPEGFKEAPMVSEGTFHHLFSSLSSVKIELEELEE